MDIHLNKMCRICLKEGDDFKSIFYNDEFASHQISVSSKIMACCSVQVKNLFLLLPLKLPPKKQKRIVLPADELKYPIMFSFFSLPT